MEICVEVSQKLKLGFPCNSAVTLKEPMWKTQARDTCRAMSTESTVQNDWAMEPISVPKPGE